MLGKASSIVTESVFRALYRLFLATAYIYKSVFDEFIYNPDTPQSQSQPQPESQEDEEEEKTSITSFEIQLTTLIDCLNIFGTAGTSASATTKYRRWKTDQPSDNEEDRNEQSSRSKKSAANGRIEQFFGSEKGTGMHLTYAGAGYPLTLLVYVHEPIQRLAPINLNFQSGGFKGSHCDLRDHDIPAGPCVNFGFRARGRVSLVLLHIFTNDDRNGCNRT